MIRVLFVCLGNICRSPMAEGLMIDMVNKAGLSDHIKIDSAGTSGWHEGAMADPRMQSLAGSHGIYLPSRSRQVTPDDFETFDYILAMDQSNFSDLRELQVRQPNAKAKVFKMRHFDPEDPEGNVPDPYYGGTRGFQQVYDILERSCRLFLEYIVAEHDLKPTPQVD